VLSASSVPSVIQNNKNLGNLGGTWRLGGEDELTTDNWETHLPVELTKNGLLINGEEVPVYSGTVHYWRLERERWPLILDRVRSLGLNMVETYIPWSVHETS